MTFLGLCWLVAFCGAFYGLLRLTLWMIREDTPSTRGYGGGRAAAALAAEPVLVPRGWSVTDYASDGIRGLQVMLVQHARNTQA